MTFPYPSIRYEYADDINDENSLSFTSYASHQYGYENDLENLIKGNFNENYSTYHLMNDTRNSYPYQENFEMDHPSSYLISKVKREPQPPFASLSVNSPTKVYLNGDGRKGSAFENNGGYNPQGPCISREPSPIPQDYPSYEEVYYKYATEDEFYEPDELPGATTCAPGSKDQSSYHCEQEDAVESFSENYIAPNGFSKPNYSFSCLIFLALKNSYDGQLTVADIYSFLCEHFPYFRAAPSGWKNSVRHNLSLNKCFHKVDVSESSQNGRRSCRWRINPQRIEKMEAELEKSRDRNEDGIKKAMERPQNLDAIQNGTMGMPSCVKKRTSVKFLPTINPIVFNPIHQHCKVVAASRNRPPQTSSNEQAPPSFREQAAKNFECLLQQKSIVVAENVAAAADADSAVASESSNKESRRRRQKSDEEKRPPSKCAKSEPCYPQEMAAYEQMVESRLFPEFPPLHDLRGEQENCKFNAVNL